MAQASELSQVQVADPRGPQLRAQDFSIELRVVSRARDTAHIYDALDAVCPQNLEKLFPSACGMPNRKNGGDFDLDPSHNEYHVPPTRAGNESRPPLLTTHSELRSEDHSQFGFRSSPDTRKDKLTSVNLSRLFQIFGHATTS